MTPGTAVSAFIRASRSRGEAAWKLKDPQNSHGDVKGCDDHTWPVCPIQSTCGCHGGRGTGCIPPAAPRELLARVRFPLIKALSMKILVANPWMLEALWLNTEECVVSAWSCSAVRRPQGIRVIWGIIDLSPGLCVVIASGRGPESRILLNSKLFPSNNLYSYELIPCRWYRIFLGTEKCWPIFGGEGYLSPKTDCTEESNSVASWAKGSSPSVLQTITAYNLIHKFRGSILTVVMDWISLLVHFMSKWQMTMVQFQEIQVCHGSENHRCIKEVQSCLFRCSLTRCCFDAAELGMLFFFFFL